MRLFIWLGIIFLLSCNNIKTEESTAKDQHIINSNIDSFDIFLREFTIKVLPISVDRKLLDDFSYGNVGLDTLLVNRFIEKNKMIIGDLSVYNSTKYYPLYKFKLHSMWCVIVMLSSGAGAIDDKYHLIVYDSAGLIKSNLIVGKEIGSCESLETETFSINSDYLISGEDNYYSGNCETGKMKLVKTEVLNYQIDKGGNIRRLD